jgi:hypothetical protein
MKKTLLSTLLLFFAFTKGFTQDYVILAKQGYKAYQDKDYAKSVEIFEQAFKLDKPKTSDLYSASWSATLSNQADKAFSFLGQAIDEGNPSFTHIKANQELVSLHKDVRWKEMILAKMEKMQADEWAKLKYPKIAKMLDSMVVPDQAIRNRHNEFLKQGVKKDSIIMKNLITEWNMIDSLNLIQTKKIFAEYGFLGFEEAGKTGSHDLWLLIQHSDKDPKFQEAVLSEMKKHVERKNANGTDYAYLIDRVNLNTGKQQIYGTQMRRSNETGVLAPHNLFEPENFNKRRAEVGLDTIEEYIETLNRYRGIKPKENQTKKSQ